KRLAPCAPLGQFYLKQSLPHKWSTAHRQSQRTAGISVSRSPRAAGESALRQATPSGQKPAVNPLPGSGTKRLDQREEQPCLGDSNQLIQAAACAEAPDRYDRPISTVARWLRRYLE